MAYFLFFGEGGKTAVFLDSPRIQINEIREMAIFIAP